MNKERHYDCHGFHDSLPKGKASGTLTIDDMGLIFTIADQRLHMPLSDIALTMGGASQRLVFFKHHALPGWTFYTADRSVLRDPDLLAEESLTSSLQKAKSSRRAGWWWLVAATVAFVCVPLFVVLRMDSITKPIAKQIPPEWEEKIGDSAIAQYRLGNTFMDDEKVKPLLEPLVQPLLDVISGTPYHYNFYVVNNGTLNAFALPGGEVVIHSALILKADSAEELLGVLGHEIAHVELQHGLRNVIGTAGIYAIAGAVFGDVSGILATLVGAAPLLLNQSYSRKFETESDVWGYEILERANIDPSGLARFFEKMIQKEDEQLANIEDKDTREAIKSAMKFLSTHPASEKRVEHLHKMHSKRASSQTYRDLSVEFKQLQDTVLDFVGAESDAEDVGAKEPHESSKDAPSAASDAVMQESNTNMFYQQELVLQPVA